jgi:hypothetical protein
MADAIAGRNVLLVLVLLSLVAIARFGTHQDEDCHSGLHIWFGQRRTSPQYVGIGTPEDQSFVTGPQYVDF